MQRSSFVWVCRNSYEQKCRHMGDCATSVIRAAPKIARLKRLITMCFETFKCMCKCICAHRTRTLTLGIAVPIHIHIHTNTQCSVNNTVDQQIAAHCTRAWCLKMGKICIHVQRSVCSRVTSAFDAFDAASQPFAYVCVNVCEHRFLFYLFIWLRLFESTKPTVF